MDVSKPLTLQDLDNLWKSLDKQKPTEVPLRKLYPYWLAMEAYFEDYRRKHGHRPR